MMGDIFLSKELNPFSKPVRTTYDCTLFDCARLGSLAKDFSFIEALISKFFAFRFTLLFLSLLKIGE